MAIRILPAQWRKHVRNKNRRKPQSFIFSEPQLTSEYYRVREHFACDLTQIMAKKVERYTHTPLFFTAYL